MQERLWLARTAYLEQTSSRRSTQSACLRNSGKRYLLQLPTNWRTALRGISLWNKHADNVLKASCQQCSNWWFTEPKESHRCISTKDTIRWLQNRTETRNFEQCPSTMCTKWRKEYTKWSTTSCTSTVPRSEKCITKWVLIRITTMNMQKDLDFLVNKEKEKPIQKPHNEYRVLKISSVT